jgi:hypothetical protein
MPGGADKRDQSVDDPAAGAPDGPVDRRPVLPLGPEPAGGLGSSLGLGLPMVPSGPAEQWPAGLWGLPMTQRRPPAQRRHRYDLTPPEVREAESRTVLQAAMAATTWAQWEAAQAATSSWGARITPVPWALDWQRNPAAPLPPGYVWLACLHLTWAGRAKDWQGKMTSAWEGRANRVVRPVSTAGDLCERCRVPIVQLANRTDPYPRLVIIADPGETVPAGAPEAVLAWARDRGFPVD